MENLYRLSQYFLTTLSVAGGIDASQTTDIVLQAVTGIDEPTKPGIALLNYSDPLETSACEWITYTSVNTTTKELQGVARGQEDYSAKAHANGVTVAFPLSKSHINNIVDKLEGLDAGVTLDQPTLTSPTVNTPTIITPTIQAWDGWIADTDTWTYASATSFTIAGKDVTAKFPKGTRIKCTNSTVKYFVVTSSTFSTNTTVNITGGTDYTLADAAISNPYYSYQANPQGYPSVFNFTPTFAAGASMTYTSVTFSACYFSVVGNVCTYSLHRAIGTTGGTAGVNLTATLPITPADDYGEGGAMTYDAAWLGGAYEIRSGTGILSVYKGAGGNWGLGASKVIGFVATYRF